MRPERNSKYHLSGRLFIFEGSLGGGKSTLAQKGAEFLSGKGVDVLLLGFPGKEPKSLGKLVDEIHRNAGSFGVDCLSPTSLRILQIAAHIECLEGRILPALSNGKTVILDGFWWSIVAYGTVAGISSDVLNAMIDLERAAWRKVKPDILFLITGHAPSREDHSDNQCPLVRSTFERLVLEEKGNYPVDVIDNSISLQEAVDYIFARICNPNPRSDKSGRLRQESLSIFYQQERKSQKAKRSREDHWAPTKTTEVFDTYWRFAAERQAIFFKRLKGEKLPWTKDPILRTYKFTNTYRASDRVSQFLLRHVIYEGEQDPNEVVFRTLLFKTFNKIETWKLLIEELGYVSWREYGFESYDRILARAQENGTSIYSAAYIMPSGGSSFGHAFKHRNHLCLLQKMMEEHLPARMVEAKSMHEVFELLRSYPMIGDFLAYQYATDINYSTVTDFSEMSFVIPGPGAKDGLKKCFSDFGGLSEVDLIKLMADRQEDEFARLGLQFLNLWGRPLQLIDCQNLFCEVDKYARIAHPEVKGITGRTRIKQKFKPGSAPIEYFYPPKWNINTIMKETLSSGKELPGE